MVSIKEAHDPIRDGMALTHRLKCAQYIAKQVIDAEITKDGHLRNDLVNIDESTFN